jgi:alkylation response protein AidB-like acyl-CoA dehydrogenase
VRFGAQARTALIDTGREVLQLDVQPGDFTPLDTIFAYPLAQLSEAARARAVATDISPARLRQCWNVALAAEIIGAMGAALATTIEHVTERKQFGQAIGAFQAVQHRLAEAAVQVESARWMTLKAADSGEAADAALAVAYAQDGARRVTYDLHQFLGAMGLTLEHPLHLWTYRLKVLVGELGGAAAGFDLAAQAVWGDAPAAGA